MMGPIDHPETYSSGLLKHPKGILLFGPPGTGKTMMAKVSADMLNAAFLGSFLWLVVSSSAGQSSFWCFGCHRLNFKSTDFSLQCSILFLLAGHGKVLPRLLHGCATKCDTEQMVWRHKQSHWWHLQASSQTVSARHALCHLHRYSLLTVCIAFAHSAAA